MSITPAEITIYKLNIAAEGLYLRCYFSDLFSVLYTAKAFAAAQLYMKMAEVMRYRSDYLFTLPHTAACTKRNSIAFLTVAERTMRLVSITPRSTSVDKCLELAGDIRPV